MSTRRAVTVVGIGAAALLALAVVAVLALRFAQSGEVRPNVAVAGVDLGGMSAEEATEALERVAAARRADRVSFEWRDRSFELAPERIDFRVDIEQTVQRAMDTGREGGWVASTLDAARALWTPRQVPLALDHDEEALSTWLDEIAMEVDREPTPGAVSADPDSLEVTVELPDDGATVRREETRELALSSLRRGGAVTAELPVEVDPTRIDAADVEEVADQARRALEEPLTLEAVGATVTLQPRDLAPMIALEAVSSGDDAWTVELRAPADVVEETFQDVAGRFEVAPTEARFEAPRVPPTTLDDKTDVTWRPRPAEVSISPSSTGSTFDPRMAAVQLSEILAEGRREATLRLAEVEPELSTEDARALNIDELLGTFTTYHACCQARVNNIQRLADMVDETLVLPEEQFSVNQISGERTCSKGFQPAGMILRGEIVDVCGGGVSQFGTTTVNAIFFAGLDPDTYQPHSFYISRYPMGREATLNYPSPDIDVRFTNDTGNGILIRTSYTATSITVSIYGHNDVERVIANHGQPTKSRSYSTERRVNRDLPPGTSRRIQSGQNGFSIRVTRTIVYEDGTEETDDWSNVYVPEKEIVEYNPDRRPPPPPPDDGGDTGGGGNDSGGGNGDGGAGNGDGDGGGGNGNGGGGDQ